MHEVARFADRTWASWTVPSFVEVDGVSTAYRRGGRGEPLLYLHGGGGTRAWTPIHAALAEHFDLIAPEHPGYGDSDRHADQDSFADLVLHYDGFLRALGLEHVHVVGTSLGAWIAADLAVFYPDRFASLTLITPLGARIVDEPFIDVFRFSPEQAAAAMFNGREGQFESVFAREGGLDDVLHSYHEDSTSALLFWNPRYDYKLDRRLARVNAPTLVIGVDDDRTAGNLQARRYAELLPGSEYSQIAGPDGAPSGHGVVFEQPDEVVAVLTAFTAEHAPTASASA